MARTSDIGFLNPVYPSFTGKRQNNEKMKWLGRIVEWYFDMGQQSYRIFPDTVLDKSVPIEADSGKRSWFAAVRRITGFALKIISYLTLILPFVMLMGKIVYRAENRFVLQRPLSEEQLQRHRTAAHKLISSTVLSEKIDAVDFTKTQGIKDSLQILEEYYAEYQEVAAILNRSAISLSVEDKATFWRAHEVLVQLLEKFKTKINDKKADIQNTAGVFQNELEIKLNQAGDRSPEAAEEVWSGLKRLDQFFTTFKDVLKITPAGNNWTAEGGRKLLKDGLIARVSDLIIPKEILNLGATCFMNSSVQALIANPEFRRRIKQEHLPIYDTLKKDMARQFNGVIIDDVPFFAERTETVCENRTENVVNTIFDTWKAFSLNELERCVDDPIATGINESLQNWIKAHSAEKAVNILDSARQNLLEYARTRTVMDTLRSFVAKYEQPGTRPQDFEALAKNLRGMLFDAGVMEKGANGEGLEEQQDAAPLVSFVLKAIGISVPYKQTQTAFDESLQPLVNIEGCQLIPLAFMQDRTYSFQELINEASKEKVSGGTTVTGAPDQCSFIHQDGSAVKVDAWKSKMGIDGDPPQYLPFQLVRFTNDLKKIENPVGFDPLIIDLTQMFNLSSDQKALYRVKSSVIHQGSLQSGHYYSVMEKGGEWFRCDDSEVTALENPQEELAKGYIFFLERMPTPTS